MYAMFLSNSYCSPWIVFVKNSLDRLGLSYIFDSQGYNVNNAWFGKIVKLRLHDCYRQTWTNELEIHENCDNYRLYKMDFCFENYLRPNKLTLMFLVRTRLKKWRCGANF